MIKKIVLFAVFTFSITSLKASHLLGGEITWECQGTNTYVFTLKLYRDCTGANLPTNNQTLTWDNGSISVAHDTTYTSSEFCYNPNMSPGCPSNVDGSVETFVYKSAPLVLPGTPPSTGWTFSLYFGGRHSASINTPTNGYYFHSKMYPSPSGECHSSPSFIGDPSSVLSRSSANFSSLASKGETEDSLYYGFVTPRQTATQLISYNPGYSSTAPFPDMTEDPANGPTSIDPTSGLVSTEIVNAPFGVYYYGLQVECWRDKHLLSRVTRDFGIYLPNTPASPNTTPSISVDTSAFSNVSLDADGRLKITVLPGDTVNFDLDGLDADMNGAFPQELTFKAAGHSLSANWPGGGNNGYSEQPVITKIGPGGFTSSQALDVNFNWVIGSEHLRGGSTSHIFNFSLQDDNCPYIAIANMTAEILVINPAFVAFDTLNICEGESAQLTGNSTLSNNYHWSPNIEISDTAAAEPYVSATSSRYYYLTDPNNPGFVDSVYVQVEPTGTFELNYANSLLSLTDSVSMGAKMWYYSGIPFTPPTDTLTPFGPGHYRAERHTESCKYFTDTIEVLPGSYSMADPNQGNLAGDLLVLQGTMGISFRLDSTASGSLQQILIPGITDAPESTSGSDLSLKLYNDQDSLLWSKDTTASGASDGIFRVQLQYSLEHQHDYTLTISGDTNYAFHYFENQKPPFHPWNNGLMITGLYEDPGTAFPTQVSERLLPVILQIEQTIGLKDFAVKSFRVYPNPAQDRFFVEGAEPGSLLQLLDMQGKILREMKIPTGEVAVEKKGLPSGFYFIRLSFDKHTEVQKIIFR